MAGERRRCRLKIAEEEILPVSPEVRERRLLLRGSRADVPPAPLLGMPREQSFFAHILISPSSGSSSTGSVGTALPSRGGGGKRLFSVGRGLAKGGNVSAGSWELLFLPADFTSMHTQSLQQQISLFICFHKR